MAIGLRELKKARVREQIVQTTIDLIREQGYDRTTVEEIARRVEITTPTFYNYFSSKEAVLGQVYAECVRSWAAAIDEQLERDVPTELRLRALVSKIAAGILEDASLWRAIIIYGDINPASNAAQREAESLADGSLYALIREGQMNGELTGHYPAALLQAVFDGAVFALSYSWAMDDISNNELASAFQAALDVCFDGIRAR